jgi:hypothetical protein
MTVTASATLVATVTADPARPAGHAGWNNPYGDPAWISDIDWYRRVQLVATGSAGEVGSIVNWELYDDTIPFKTAADITAATAGSVASPYGAVINHTTTWTVWATTGVATAAAAKYTDTGVAAFSKLRANNPRVQVLLGNRKKVGAADQVWTVALFLPGAGRIPSATTTITVSAPASLGVAGYALKPEEGGPGPELLSEEPESEPEESRPEPRIILEDEQPEDEPIGPDSGWTKAEIADWLANQGVEAYTSLSKKNLLGLADDVLSGDGG